MRAHAAPPLPTVIVTSVIRATYQGQSHGGVYLVDLDAERARQVLDWNDSGINWEGRGGDRGLRGVAFWEGQVFLAASDEIFVYDPEFTPLRSFRNAYLRHCHEIFVDRDELLLTSCGFDSILRYDLRAQRFTAGYCLREAPSVRLAAAGLKRVLTPLGRQPWRPHPRMRCFDPERDGGPEANDTHHVNSVTCLNGDLYAGGTGLGHVYRIRSDQLSVYATTPGGTHNAQPFDGGVLVNDTASDRVAWLDRDGTMRACFDVPSYPAETLEQVELAHGTARQAFGRGLAVWKDRYLITGSSPATIAVHDLVGRETVRSVNLTMDVRNAIHGLEIWPFATEG